LQGFRLVGSQYQAIPLVSFANAPNGKGWYWSETLGLYLGVEAGKLRYFTAEGSKVPTPEEAAEQEQQRAEQLAAQLRALGVNPDLDTSV